MSAPKTCKQKSEVRTGRASERVRQKEEYYIVVVVVVVVAKVAV